MNEEDATEEHIPEIKPKHSDYILIQKKILAVSQAKQEEDIRQRHFELAKASFPYLLNLIEWSSYHYYSTITGSRIEQIKFKI